MESLLNGIVPPVKSDDSDDVVRSIGDNTECCICLDVFKDPMFPKDICIDFAIKSFRKITVAENSYRVSSRLKFKALREQVYASKQVLDRLIRDETNEEAEVQKLLKLFRDKFVRLSALTKKALDSVEFSNAKKYFLNMINEWLIVNDRIIKMKRHK
ncbi:hypothetical protein ACOME3_008645 [Neoechinorhynchus agilis]